MDKLLVAKVDAAQVAQSGWYRINFFNPLGDVIGTTAKLYSYGEAQTIVEMLNRGAREPQTTTTITVDLGKAERGSRAALGGPTKNELREALSSTLRAAYTIERALFAMEKASALSPTDAMRDPVHGFGREAL